MKFFRKLFFITFVFVLSFFSIETAFLETQTEIFDIYEKKIKKGEWNFLLTKTKDYEENLKYFLHKNICDLYDHLTGEGKIYPALSKQNNLYLCWQKVLSNKIKRVYFRYDYNNKKWVKNEEQDQNKFMIEEKDQVIIYAKKKAEIEEDLILKIKNTKAENNQVVQEEAKSGINLTKFIISDFKKSQIQILKTKHQERQKQMQIKSSDRKEDFRLIWNKEQNNPRLISGYLSAELSLVFRNKENYQKQALLFLEENKELFALKADMVNSFILKENSQSENNINNGTIFSTSILGINSGSRAYHLHLQQSVKFNGEQQIPIWLHDIAFHFNKEGVLYLVNGNILEKNKLETLFLTVEDRAKLQAPENANIHSNLHEKKEDLIRNIISSVEAKQIAINDLSQQDLLDSANLHPADKNKIVLR